MFDHRDSGLFVNGEHVYLNGVCDHHDLGALGAAFNDARAERQLEILAEMGCNAIRTSHNPPAPELLELADQMGFLVMDEAFDAWVRQKTPFDFHLVFPDWHEQDLAGACAARPQSSFGDSLEHRQRSRRTIHRRSRRRGGAAAREHRRTRKIRRGRRRPR